MKTVVISISHHPLGKICKLLAFPVESCKDGLSYVFEYLFTGIHVCTTRRCPTLSPGGPLDSGVLTPSCEACTNVGLAGLICGLYKWTTKPPLRDTMGTHRRNDIAVGIENNGDVWIAQGGPATSKMMAKDLSESETHLFYSQVYHRCAWRNPLTKKLHVGTPTEARQAGAAATVPVHPPYAQMTGAPCLAGRVA